MPEEQILIILISITKIILLFLVKSHFSSKKHKKNNYIKLEKKLKQLEEKIDYLNQEHKKLNQAFEIYVEHNGVDKKTKKIIKKIIKK